MPVSPLTHAKNVQVHQTPKLAELSLLITPLKPSPTTIALQMPPDISDIDSSLAYKLRLIHRAALKRKIADTNWKKGHVLYEKDYKIHVRSEPRFAAGARSSSNVPIH